MSMDLKEKKLLLSSIFIVLLSSWFIGNLMDLKIESGKEIVILPTGGENMALVIMTLLILIPLSYISYISYRSKKESDFMLSKILLIGFWIFLFLGGIVLVIFGFFPLTVLLDFLPNVPLPFDLRSPFPPLYLDIGFILLLSLLGIFFSIYLYLNIHAGRMKTKEGDLDISEMNSDIYLKKESEEETIEDSLTSTLNRAINEIGEGSDVRTTVINSYNEMTRLLEEKGAENDASMTPREFKDEIIKEIPAAENFVSNITFLFEEARYSPHELEEKDRKEVIHQLEELKGKLQ